MAAKSPMERSAEAYIKGKIHISGINRFTRTFQMDGNVSYATSMGAFMFPVKGACDIRFDEVCFKARSGVMIHGCPGKRISFHVTQEPFVYVNLYYETDSRLLFEHALEDPEEIGRLLQKLVAVASRDQEKSYEQKHLLTLIFEQIYAEYIPPEARNNAEIVQQAAAYIREHCAMNLRLDFIAEQFGKSGNQLSYLFYAYRGIRPIGYLIECRLEAACELLSGSSLSIREIARRIGYSDPLYFSRLFKKHRKCSPCAFRALYAQDSQAILSSQQSALAYRSGRN